MDSLKMNIDIDMSRDMQSDQLHELEAYDIRKMMSGHIYMCTHHIYICISARICVNTHVYTTALQPRYT